MKTRIFLSILCTVNCILFTLAALCNLEKMETPLAQCVFWIYMYVCFLGWLTMCVEYDHEPQVKSGIIVHVLMYMVYHIVWWIPENFVEIKAVLVWILQAFMVLEVMLYWNAEKKCKKQEERGFRLDQKELKRYLKENMIHKIGLTKGNRIVNEPMEIAVWNAGAFLILLLSYASRFLKDIVEVCMGKSYTDLLFVILYVSFMLADLWIGVKKGRLLGYKRIKTVTKFLLLAAGVYCFVFWLNGIAYAKIMLIVYLVAPEVVDLWKVGRKYQMKQRER